MIIASIARYSICNTPITEGKIVTAYRSGNATLKEYHITAHFVNIYSFMCKRNKKP